MDQWPECIPSAGRRYRNEYDADDSVGPSAVLLIQNGVPRLINIKNQDTVTKVLDMVPDLINRFTGKTEPVDPEAQDIIDHMGEE